MKTVTVQTYEFEELSDEVKARLIEKERYREYQDFPYCDDMIESMKKGLDAFSSLKMTNWSIDYSCAARSRVTVAGYGEHEEDICGRKLYSHLMHYRSLLLKKKAYYISEKGEPTSSGTYIPREYYKGDDGKRQWKITCKYRTSKILFLEGPDDCPLTGVTSDFAFLQPIINYLAKPDLTTTFRDLIESCVENTLSEIEKEYDYMNSDEYITEDLIGQDQDYLEDGTVFTHFTEK